LGGFLTIVSPCILPVLPFVFARANRPFLRSGLPILIGMALTFAAIATLAAVATGLSWAPCAGPILGLILTGAALRGVNAETSLLLLTFAGGAATSLALALLVGGRFFAAMKRSLGAGEWIRRGLGAAVLHRLPHTHLVREHRGAGAAGHIAALRREGTSSVAM
jgi:cytochrome c biogenesis protein CcdA